MKPASRVKKEAASSEKTKAAASLAPNSQTHVVGFLVFHTALFCSSLTHVITRLIGNQTIPKKRTRHLDKVWLLPGQVRNLFPRNGVKTAPPPRGHRCPWTSTTSLHQLTCETKPSITSHTTLKSHTKSFLFLSFCHPGISTATADVRPSSRPAPLAEQPTDQTGAVLKKPRRPPPTAHPNTLKPITSSILQKGTRLPYTTVKATLHDFFTTPIFFFYAYQPLDARVNLLPHPTHKTRPRSHFFIFTTWQPHKTVVRQGGQNPFRLYSATGWSKPLGRALLALSFYFSTPFPHHAASHFISGDFFLYSHGGTPCFVRQLRLEEQTTTLYFG